MPRIPWKYALLVFVPITLIAELASANDTLIFIAAALAVIPLAGVVGEGTEELARHTGPQIGGLLNATLGNAAELIITIFAIQRGLLELVKASIIGSILGNLLLVLGLSLLLGGIRNGLQRFDRRNAAMHAALLLLALVALMVPSLFDSAIADDPSAELRLSEGVAIIMMLLYGLSVFYSFRSSSAENRLQREAASPHETKWSTRQALLILAAATIGIVLMSEALIGAVESVTHQLGLTEFFIGIIIIPLVGNVAEHLVAVKVAIKNRMDLSMAVSIGSSTQIALFVAPLLVFIALLFGERLLLVYNNYELVALAAASLIAAFIALDGESNWLEGAMLLAVYAILALAFYFVPMPT